MEHIKILSPPVKRARSTSTSLETPEEELERLRVENAGLKDEIFAMEAQLYAVRPMVPAHHLRKSSTLPSGKEVRISAVELAAMKAIFDLFDVSGEGKISPNELKALHQKLGEPISDEEAEAAVKDIGRGHGGLYISFEDFCAYWDGIHPTQRGTASGGIGGFTSLTPSAPASLERGDSGFSATGSGTAAAAAAGEAAAGAATGGAGTSASASAGSLAVTTSLEATARERERKRQWYQARFKFVKAKISNPAVGRIYTEASGAFPSLEYRVRFYTDDDASGTRTEISPWHDVPYKNPDGSYNMLVEIPKWTRRKFEIATTEPYNPIKQDLKNGVLREYTYGDMLFNYGAIPQTWENPKYVHPDTKSVGDNDPIDIVDIGTKQWSTGSIVSVKVLGVLGLIDSNETDWKLIAINTEDPLAALVHDIEDVEVHCPGAVTALHHWLRHYKAPLINEFAYEGAAKGRAFAEKLIEETHEEWLKLIEERGSRAVVTKD